MDQVRRIIIQKSDSGYKFSIKDIGVPYDEAAPINKVTVNGPADCAGLRSGDGLLSINSNLVRGKNHQDLVNIIKQSGDKCLELSIFENYFADNKSKFSENEDLRKTNNSTPLSIDENDDEYHKSPSIIRKRAYNSVETSNRNQLSSSSTENILEVPQSSLRTFQNDCQPKISFKPAKSPEPIDKPSTSVTTNKVSHRPAYNKHSGINQIPTSHHGHDCSAKRILQLSNNNNHSNDAYYQKYNFTIESSHNNKVLTNSHVQHERRGSTPIISDCKSYTEASTAYPYLTATSTVTSTITTTTTLPKNSTSTATASSDDKLYAQQLSNSYSTLSHELTTSIHNSKEPLLPLNRVGGLVRTPTNNEDDPEVNPSSTKSSSTKKPISSGDRYKISAGGAAISGKTNKYRYLYNSPTPYRSSSSGLQNVVATTNNATLNVSTHPIGKESLPMKYNNNSSNSSYLTTTSTAAIDQISGHSIYSKRSPVISSRSDTGNSNNNSSTSLHTRNNKGNDDINLESLHFQEFDPKKLTTAPVNTDLSDPSMPGSGGNMGISADVSSGGHHYQRHNTGGNAPKLNMSIIDKDDGNQEVATPNSASRHLKKLKNIFGDNYRGRSKTLDSDRKLKENDDLDPKYQEMIGVLVKWIHYEGKSQKSSWKNYSMHLEEDDRIIFTREKLQIHLTSGSLEEVTMQIPIKNAIVDEESEKRGRKNIVKILQQSQSASTIGQSECLVEFPDKATANKWVVFLQDKAKPPDKDDKAARTASFKERHSLTVPNLYSKEPLSVQSQYAKTKSKSKDESTVSSNMCISSTASIPMNSSTGHMTNAMSSSASSNTTTTTNKGVIHTAMSHIKNLKHKFGYTPTTTDFEKQQEEWFSKQSSAPLGQSQAPDHSSNQTSSSHFISSNNKLASSNSCTDDMSHMMTSGGGHSNAMSMDNMDGVVLDSLTDNSASLPLHLWTRSIVSPLIPMIVEICVSIIEKFGMDLVGLYRVSGNKVTVNTILAEMRKPVSDIDVDNPLVKWNDLHAICGVLKQFLRNLPDGLFPKSLYPEVMSAARMFASPPDRERRLLSFQRLLSIMDLAQDRPQFQYHRETLRYLVEHLGRVASRQAHNKMTVRNLAVVFAPTILPGPPDTCSATANESMTVVNDYNTKIQLVESLIKYHKWLFSNSIESGCLIPPNLDEDTTALYDPANDDPSITGVDVVPYDVSESTATAGQDNDMTDARPLVSEILARVKKILATNHSNNRLKIDMSQGDGTDQKRTLAELSLEAHRQNMDIGGFKEVNIDEECDKRLGNKEKMKKLRQCTDRISRECLDQMEEMSSIQAVCESDSGRYKHEMDKIDRDIQKIEHYDEKNKVSGKYDDDDKNSEHKEISNEI